MMNVTALALALALFLLIVGGGLLAFALLAVWNRAMTPASATARTGCGRRAGEHTTQAGATRRGSCVTSCTRRRRGRSWRRVTRREWTKTRPTW